MKYTSNFITIETSKGLMTIPCKIANAISSKSTSMTCLACPTCNGDIGLMKYCKSCCEGKDKVEIESSLVKSAIRVSKEQKILLTDELEQQISEVDKVIQVLGSINKDHLDTRRIIGSYYVIPDKKSPKPVQKFYTKLQKGLLSTEKNLVVRFANSSKEKLGILTARDNYILLLNVAYLEDFNEFDQEIESTLEEPELQAVKAFLSKIKPVNIDSIIDLRREKIEKIILSGDTTTIKEPEIKTEIDFFDSDPIEVIAEQLKQEAKEKPVEVKG